MTINTAAVAAWQKYVEDPSPEAIEALARAYSAHQKPALTAKQEAELRDLLQRLVPVVHEFHRLRESVSEVQAEILTKRLLAELMGGAE